MFRPVFLIIFLFITWSAFSQQAEFKLYLVGDAGENEITGETLDSLKSKILTPNPQMGEQAASAIIFMGDNAYKNMLLGLVEGFKGFDSSKITIRKLRSQLDVLNGYRGSVYFVPGNHDWWNILKFEKGKRKLRMEESFIEESLKKNTTIANPGNTFLPKNGSPGPASVELDNKKVRVVFIDTYWLILLGFKNNPKGNFSVANTFYHNLDSILNLATREHQNIIVVAHHPVNSTWPVGKGILKHPYFFGRIKQNLQTFPSYDTLCVKINAILQKYPGVYYASGHIHALQFHTDKGVNYIISGAGSKTHNDKKDFNYCIIGEDCNLWNEKGFFEMDFYDGYSPAVIIYHDDGRERMEIKASVKN